MPKVKIHPRDSTCHMYWDVATQLPNCFWVRLAQPHWEWNGDLEKPTVHPSILNTKPDGSRNHVFITDGKIHYLSDCTHELAGRVVDMVDFPDDW